MMNQSVILNDHVAANSNRQDVRSKNELSSGECNSGGEEARREAATSD
jgi:hypothetical protein